LKISSGEAYAAIHEYGQQQGFSEEEIDNLLWPKAALAKEKQP
jgi:hypothetical protein